MRAGSRRAARAHRRPTESWPHIQRPGGQSASRRRHRLDSRQGCVTPGVPPQIRRSTVPSGDQRGAGWFSSPPGLIGLADIALAQDGLAADIDKGAEAQVERHDEYPDAIAVTGRYRRAGAPSRKPAAPSGEPRRVSWAPSACCRKSRSRAARSDRRRSAHGTRRAAQAVSAAPRSHLPTRWSGR